MANAAAAAPCAAIEVLFEKLQNMEEELAKATSQAPSKPVPAVTAFTDHALQAIAGTAVEGIQHNPTVGRRKLCHLHACCLLQLHAHFQHKRSGSRMHGNSWGDTACSRGYRWLEYLLLYDLCQCCSPPYML